jgi:hypothetical protein
MSKTKLPTLPAASNIINTNTECETVERAVADLIKLERSMAGGVYSPKLAWFVILPFKSDDLAGARQTQAEVQQALKLLPAVMRPAEADEIATQLALLTACYPNPSKGEWQIFTQTLCQDVANLKPSVYALQLACRRLRQNYKFLPSIAEVLTELKKANQEAGRLEKLDARLSELKRYLDNFEEEQLRWKKEQRQERLQRAKRFPREFYQNDMRVLNLPWFELRRRFDAWKSRQPRKSQAARSRVKKSTKQDA